MGSRLVIVEEYWDIEIVVSLSKRLHASSIVKE